MFEVYLTVECHQSVTDQFRNSFFEDALVNAKLTF